MRCVNSEQRTDAQEAEQRNIPMRKELPVEPKKCYDRAVSFNKVA